MKIMDKTARLLKDSGIENYLFEAKIINDHAKQNNLDVYALIKRRISREPLQYIIGEWEFYGDIYKLNKDCLIPRPETELLTEYIIDNARPGAVILDLCSGSGCVSISALKRREDLTAVLIDISSGAIQISRVNAELNKVADRTKFYCLDVLKNAPQIMKICAPDLPDLIAANPPYLSAGELDQIRSEKSELSHEPEAAFFGGDDGLDFYRKIIAGYKNICREFVFECGIGQYKKICEIFAAHGFNFKIINDYNKIERIIVGGN